MTRFKVVGVHPVLGHAPGETFDADLDETQAQALVDGGALRRVGGARQPREKDDAPSGATRTRRKTKQTKP